MHPVDTIRARMQVERVGSAQYRSTAHAFRSIIQKEGVSYLYKGFPIVVTATIPAHALYFFGYEFSKRQLAPLVGDGPLNHFVSGLVADVAGAMIWTPMDIVKQRLQVQSLALHANPTHTFYKGSFHAARTIVREEGVRGLYKGFWPSLATFGPLIGIYFATYEKTKKMVSGALGIQDVRQLPVQYQLSSGFFAGSVAAAVTCPLDVIKTRIQVSRANERTYNGIVDGFKKILKEEGPRAFVKGMGARILWIAPGNAITIASYEQLKLFFTNL
eukprot:gene2336-2650_t